MNLQKYLDSNGLKLDDVTNMLKGEYPKISRSPLSMVKSGTYGVVLAPKAVKILNEAHPVKKENRKKGHQLTVRVDDRLFGMIERFCEKHKVTTQDLVERAIFGYIDSSETIIEVLNNICKVEEEPCVITGLNQ